MEIVFLDVDYDSNLANDPRSRNERNERLGESARLFIVEGSVLGSG